MAASAATWIHQCDTAQGLASAFRARAPRSPQGESAGTRLRARQLAYVTLAVTDTSFRNANSMELQRRCVNSAAIRVFGQ